MWLKFFVFLIVTFVNNVQAQVEKGNCKILTDDNQWETELKFIAESTDSPGKNDIKVAENITECSLSSKYVSCSMDENNENVIFSLTEDFTGYVENEINNQQRYDINFICLNGESVTKTFRLLVVQKEFFPSTFIKNKFEFHLKMPLAPSTEIAGTEIQVKDINLEDQKKNLQFTLSADCSDNFEFGSITGNGIKQYTTNLKTKNKIVTLNQDLNCKVTVKNKLALGENSADMVLQIDAEESIPPNPIFVQPMYVSKLLENNKIEPTHIKLINEVFDPTITFCSDAPDYEKYFEFDKSKMIFSSKESLPENAFDERNFITFTITATYDKAEAPGKTIIIINPPLKDNGIEIIPEFEYSLYVAQYINPNEIEHEPIKLRSDKEATYDIISDDFSQYFEFDSNTNKVLVKDLPEIVFKKVDYISIIIEARYEDIPFSGKTAVIINGPQENLPVFKQDVYEAEYISSNEIKHEEIILSGDYYHEPIINIHSEHEAHFYFDNGQLLVKPENPLPVSVFDGKNFIFVTIEAKYDDYGISGKTVVIINAPHEIPKAEFEKDIYEVEYQGDNDIDIEEFKFKNNNENYEVSYTILSETENLAKHFDVVDNKLKIIHDLPETIFDNKNYISLSIEAKYNGASLSGRTIVIINGPENNLIATPVFEEAYYVARYIDENTIKHDDIILQVDDSSFDVDFNIISEYKSHFEFDNTEHKLVIIKPIEKNEFENKHFISVTIEAKYKGATKSGYTVVIIESPKSPNDSKLTVYYKKQVEVIVKDPPISEGIIGIYEAESDISDEQIIYSFETSDTSIASKFEYTNNGELKLKGNLPDTKLFYQITLHAKGEQSNSEATMNVILIVNNKLISPPVFEEAYYDAKYIDENTIEHDDIILQLDDTSLDVDFNIVSDYESHFQFDNTKHQLVIIKPIEENEFENRHFISVTIEAKYKGENKSGYTVVIIESPKSPNVKQRILSDSKQTVYYKKQVDVIVKDPPISEGTIGIYEAESDISDEQIIYSFETSDSSIASKFEYTNNGELKLKDNLPDTKHFYQITLRAKGKQSNSEATMNVILLVNNKLISPPVFEEAYYNATYIDENTIKHDDIKLQVDDTSLDVDFNIISDYESHFEFDNIKHKLVIIKPIEENEFENKHFISVTIEAKYKGANKSGYTVVIIESPKSPDDSKLTVYYKKQVEVIVKDPPISEGTIGIYEAESDISDEKIIYSILPSDDSNKFEYTNDGELKVKENLPDTKHYYEITLHAEGKISESEATMSIILIVNKVQYKNSIFDYSLEVRTIPEDSPKTLIVSEIKNYEFQIDNTEWFETDKRNVFLKAEIDRENTLFKDMMVVQVKTQVQAIEITSNPSSFKNLISNLGQESKTQGSCIDISSIPVSPMTMEVVVIIGDKNDNRPTFAEQNPLIIGYPSSELTNFIAPSYLVKVTATDPDLGENATIRYSVNKDFIIDPKNGIIYPGEDLSSDTEFVVTATDRDGAKDGLTSTLNVKVKILKEEHITVLTVNNILYSEIDNFIEELSLETKTTVKYLSSSVLPKSEDSSEEEDKSEEKDDETFRVTRDDDKIPVLRIVTYALDKEQVLLADDFKNLIEESNMKESVAATAYATPSDAEETNNTGWIAAVSTLSVLLGLVIIAVIAAYIFYIRPKIVGGRVPYEKHETRESTYMAPVETKINETKVADRRPTGFPVGFTPKDLDDEDESDSVNDKKTEEENDEVFIVENKYSEPTNERKKSVVKFDQNVTEIEIEVSEL